MAILALRISLTWIAFGFLMLKVSQKARPYELPSLGASIRLVDVDRLRRRVFKSDSPIVSYIVSVRNLAGHTGAASESR